MFSRVYSLLLAIFLSMVSAHLLAGTSFDFSGKTEFEFTAYLNEGEFPQQNYHINNSIALTPEFYWQWDSDNSLSFTPFIRADQQDDERSHGDIRELAWTHVNNNWEIHSGIRKVFWGVSEFNHLVDIINQTDAVESFDGEEKLGQPMIHISRVTDWGIIDSFVLLGFRERSFVGEDGRLRGPLIVNTNRATYESGSEEKHIDLALRWSHSFNVFDFGLYWFNGTDREPVLQIESRNGRKLLTPYYQQMSQLGLDLQATIDSWLWKLEAIHKNTNMDKYSATQAGFEYTFYGINQSTADLGLLLEYGWDERGRNAASIAQNDIYLGARLTLNDADDSSLLAGFAYDLDYHTRNVLIEASKRLNDRWTIALEALVFIASDEEDTISFLDKDDRVQLSLERFF